MQRICNTFGLIVEGVGRVRNFHFKAPSADKGSTSFNPVIRHEPHV